MKLCPPPSVNFINKRAFYANIFAPKNYKAKHKLRKAVQFAFVQKWAHKMLMKLTPRVSRIIWMDPCNAIWILVDQKSLFKVPSTIISQDFPYSFLFSLYFQTVISGFSSFKSLRCLATHTLIQKILKNGHFCKSNIVYQVLDWTLVTVTNWLFSNQFGPLLSNNLSGYRFNPKN